MAINWGGKWKLTAAAQTHKDLKLATGDSEFSLTPVGASGRAFTVVPDNGHMTPAWDDCVLLARVRNAELALPWPLPQQPSAQQALRAGEFIKKQLDEMEPEEREGLTRLEGDVKIDGTAIPVALYAVREGYPNGDPMLVVYLIEPSNPDGSAVGGRNN